MSPGLEPVSPSHEYGASPRSGWIAAMLISIGAGCRILSYCYSENSGGDAWARTALAAHWLQHPKFQVIFEDYAPGHFWLIGLFNVFIHDVTAASRLLSLTLGILSLFAFWKLAQSIYGDAAALLSLTAFTFYSLHIGYSSTSSGEVPYLFFLLAGLAFFFAALRDESRRTWMLALAGVSLSVSETIRLEAWVIFFALGVALLVLVVRFGRDQSVIKSQIWSLVAFGITGAAAPAFLTLYSWRVFGDLNQVLTLHNVVVVDFLRDHPVPLTYQLALTPGVLLLTLSPFVLVGAIYGLFKSFITKSTAVFGAVTIFFVLVQQWEIVRGKLLAVARFSITPGTLLAVISGYGLLRLVSAFPAKRRQLILTVVVASVVLNTLFILGMSERPNRLSEKFASISPRLRYPKWISEVGHYLRAHMGAEDAMIVDNYNDESGIIAMAAGLPLQHGTRAYLANARNEFNPPEYIAQQRPRFLVFSDQGTLHHWLPLPRDCKDAEISGASYHCVFSNQIYRVYTIGYP